MGREVRRVPENWEHPKNSKGYHEPLLGGSFSERLARWEEEAAQWGNGFHFIDPLFFCDFPAKTPIGSLQLRLSSFPGSSLYVLQ